MITVVIAMLLVQFASGIFRRFWFFGFGFWLLAFWLAPLTFVTFVLPPSLRVARLVALSASRAALWRVFLIQAVMPNHVWFSPVPFSSDAAGQRCTA